MGSYVVREFEKFGFPCLFVRKKKDLKISLDTSMGDFGVSPCPISQQIKNKQDESFFAS